VRKSIFNIYQSSGFCKKKSLERPVKLLFAQKMSTTPSTSTSTSPETIVHQELDRLFSNSVITEKEFGDLLTYIFNNPDKIPDLEDSLKYGNDNVKAIYLRNILTGMSEV
jgi:hypothetical protein